MKRKIINNIDIDCLFGDINYVIKELQRLKAKHSLTHEKITIEEVWTGYEDVHYELILKRNETDKEYSERLESERVKRERTKEKAEAKKIKLEELRKDKINKLRKKLEELEK